MTVQTVSVAEVSEVLGIGARRVQQLVAAGVIPRPDRGAYDLRAAVRGYAGYITDRKPPDSGTPHRARLWAAKASALELELAEAQARTVSVAEVQAVSAKACRHIKARLRAIAATVAPAVAVETSTATCQTLLSEAIDAALTELAESELGIL